MRLTNTISINFLLSENPQSLADPWGGGGEGACAPLQLYLILYCF